VYVKTRRPCRLFKRDLSRAPTHPRPAQRDGNKVGQEAKQIRKQKKRGSAEEGWGEPVRLADVLKSTLRPIEMVCLEPMNYFLKCDRAMLNLSVLDYPNHADNVKTLTEHVPHPFDEIVPIMNTVLVSVLDPLGLQVILFDYGNLDRTRSDGKIE